MSQQLTTMRRVSSLPFQKLNDEVLVVDPRTREVHLLNVTATRIWDLLENPLTADELLVVLCREFDGTPDLMRAEVDQLLVQLEAKGLVGADANLEFLDGDQAGGP